MPQGIRVVSDVFEGIYYTFWHFESVIGAWVLNTVVIPNFQYGWWLVVGAVMLRGGDGWGWPTTLIYMHTCSNGPGRYRPKLVRLQVKTYKLAPEEGTACFLGLEQADSHQRNFDVFMLLR